MADPEFEEHVVSSVILFDKDGNAFSSQLDAGVRRLEIAGKVSITGATPPPATSSAIIFADTPLTVGLDDTVFLIPDTETFHLQEVVLGNEDPTKGAKVTVLFDDGAEHVITRVFSNGFTLVIGFPDVVAARDGTPLLGDGVASIIVRREKYTGSDIAIDAVVRGYTT
jgi:hypothetical protein